MSSLAYVAFVLASLAVPAQGLSNFTNPGMPGPPGEFDYNTESWAEGGDRVWQWETDLEYTDLLMWQEYPAATKAERYYMTLAENMSYPATVWKTSFDGFSTDLERLEDGVFFLATYAAGSSDCVAISHYFNLTIPVDNPPIWIAPYQSAVAPTNPNPVTKPAIETASTSGSGTATSAPEIPASDSNTGRGDSGLSTGAVAGIAVGAAAGGLLLLAGLGFLIWRRFRKGARSQGQQETLAVQEQRRAELASAAGQEKPAELAVQEKPGELATHPSILDEGNYARSHEGLHEAP